MKMSLFLINIVLVHSSDSGWLLSQFFINDLPGGPEEFLALPEMWWILISNQRQTFSVPLLKPNNLNHSSPSFNQHTVTLIAAISVHLIWVQHPDDPDNIWKTELQTKQAFPLNTKPSHLLSVSSNYEKITISPWIITIFKKRSTFKSKE